MIYFLHHEKKATRTCQNTFSMEWVFNKHEADFVPNLFLESQHVLLNYMIRTEIVLRQSIFPICLYRFPRLSCVSRYTETMISFTHKNITQCKNSHVLCGRGFTPNMNKQNEMDENKTHQLVSLKPLYRYKGRTVEG